MTAADLHPDTREDRPSSCCGVCPPIAGGGYDCTCAGLPGCPANARAVLSAAPTDTTKETDR